MPTSKASCNIQQNEHLKRRVKHKEHVGFAQAHPNTLSKYMHARFEVYNIKLPFHIVAIDCGTLRAPLNGQLNITSSTFGSVAVYSCMPPYMLSGNVTRTCQSSGEWSGSEPVCSKFSLHHSSLTMISYASLLYSLNVNSRQRVTFTITLSRLFFVLS